MAIALMKSEFHGNTKAHINYKVAVALLERLEKPLRKKGDDIGKV